MQPCPLCGKPTKGTAIGDVVHGTCASCTALATGIKPVVTHTERKPNKAKGKKR